MKITVTKNVTHALVAVEGTLSNESLRDFEIEMDKLLDDGGHILVDFSKLTFILSSGLSALLSCHVQVKEKGHHFIIFGLNGELKKLFVITDLIKHLNIRADAGEAMEMLKKPSS